MLRFITVVVLAAGMAAPQSTDPWSAVKFLAGEWKGEGSGKPGQGEGAFSFRFELDGKVMVRRSWSAYPAQAGRPAFRHEDMMVLYVEDGLRAVYCDNEGHTIHYRGTAADGTVTFLGEEAPRAPRLRLTYRATGRDTVLVRFEMAPPGKPEAFATYVEGTSRRSAP